MEHGEYSMYVHGKCRGDDCGCKVANTEYMRNYRADQKAAKERAEKARESDEQ